MLSSESEPTVQTVLSRGCYTLRTKSALCGDCQPFGVRERLMTEKDNEPKASEKAQSPGRKPYQKPVFRYERVFETMALSCGKMNPTQFQCRFNRKNS